VFLLRTDEWEDREALCRLLMATANALPMPAPKVNALNRSGAENPEN
jgi:hypothetical protein